MTKVLYLGYIFAATVSGSEYSRRVILNTCVRERFTFLEFYR